MEWPKGVAILRVLYTESVVSNMNNFYSLFLYFGTQKYFIFFNLDFLLRVETTAVLNQGFPTLKKKKRKKPIGLREKEVRYFMDVRWCYLSHCLEDSYRLLTLLHASCYESEQDSGYVKVNLLQGPCFVSLAAIFISV